MQSFIHLAGAVALLLWGTYMVKTAMLRTFGAALRTQLARFLTNRLSGFFCGAGLASLLQSSTASALLVAGLQSEGIVSTAMALSAVLGADLGSAVMAKVLTLNLSWAAPLLILTGTLLFLKRSGDRAGQFGRVLLGLGFILTALQFIVTAVAPFKAEAGTLFDAVNHTPTLAFFAGIALSAASFSSLAAVVLTAGFAANGMLIGISPLWILLGANLGSALLAVLVSIGGSPTARQAPLGNLIFRTAGVILGLIFCFLFSLTAEKLLLTCGLIGCHIAFNASVGIIGLLFIHPIARMLNHRLSDSPKNISSDLRLRLSDENLINPEAALDSVQSETRSNLSALQLLWDKLPLLLRMNPPEGEILLLKENRRTILQRYRMLNLFLSALVQQNLSPAETLRWQHLQTVNESIRSAASAAGDIVDTLINNKCRQHRHFSQDGLAELLSLHKAISQNMHGVTTLLDDTSGINKNAAAEAVRDTTRQLERQEFPLIRRHMARVAAGLTESEETSALHVELLSLFRRFNTHVTAAASIKNHDG